MDVRSLPLGVLAGVGVLWRQLAENLHDVEQDPGRVEGLDDVLAELGGSVFFVSPGEESHRVILESNKPVFDNVKTAEMSTSYLYVSAGDDLARDGLVAGQDLLLLLQPVHQGQQDGLCFLGLLVD